MKTMYVCKQVRKEIEEDNFENGCVFSTLQLIMCDNVYITAITLKELLYKLSKTYGLEIDEIYINLDSDVVDHFIFSR